MNASTTLNRIVLALFVLAASIQSAKAAERSQESYSAKLGDKQVTSVKRQPGNNDGVYRGLGVGLNKVDLIKAARTSVTSNVRPAE